MCTSNEYKLFLKALTNFIYLIAAIAVRYTINFEINIINFRQFCQNTFAN